MDTYWIIGAVGFLIFFVIGEAYAFKHPDRQNTLSRFIATLGQKFPLSLWLCGIVIGGLAVHFYWHWCPFGGTGVGWNDLLRVLG